MAVHNLQQNLQSFQLILDKAFFKVYLLDSGRIYHQGGMSYERCQNTEVSKTMAQQVASRHRDPTAKIQVFTYCQELLQQKYRQLSIAKRSYSKNTGIYILPRDLQQKYRQLNIVKRSYSKNTGSYILPGDPTAKIQVFTYCQEDSTAKIQIFLYYQEILQQKYRQLYIDRRSCSRNTGSYILPGDPTAEIQVVIH